MEQKQLSELTEQELLDLAKKVKSSSIYHAVLIGFLIGIVIYSAINNALGFLTLIPLFLAYKLIKGPGYRSKDVNEELKKRKFI
ncbi:hypothetical protein DFQ04_2969 [Algoriphagus boseongensis]|uniref:FUSC family protein n=1 Tax=Algoriphagus boseongensis TaxID=1442587 RepID=A0A4R6T325_9BACT|nr:FUSC family protein [Algoriphagus boseongensis]TDQ15083.1 hypothetical protein DFQ04_2969 [Algoriphagus boseongensis]